MNLIFCSYAYLDSYTSTVENVLIEKDQKNKIEMYLKCCVVSLVSAKIRNPDCDVALITNIEVPEPYKTQFKTNGILIIQKEYDSFRLGKNMKWSLAFYKLCALKFAVDNLNYDKYLIVDSDTYFISKVNDLWIEADYNVLLFDMSHSLSTIQSQTMNNEYYSLYNQKVLLTNYGGEFICGNSELLKEFLNECYSIYLDMKKIDFKTNHGDEFITCIAAHRNKNIIKNGSAYIYRYWTGRFYLVSTNYIYNPVNILHVPSEKETGLKYTYNYINKNQNLPEDRKVFRLLGLPSDKRSLSIITIINFLKKIRYRLIS